MKKVLLSIVVIAAIILAWNLGKKSAEKKHPISNYISFETKDLDSNYDYYVILNSSKPFKITADLLLEQPLGTPEQLSKTDSLTNTLEIYRVSKKGGPSSEHYTVKNKYAAKDIKDNPTSTHQHFYPPGPKPMENLINIPTKNPPSPAPNN